MSQLPPAGWHPDPLGRQAQRYWDGQQWTEHVADQAGNMSTDPLDGGGQAQQAHQSQDAQGDAAGGDGGAWSNEQAGSGWGQDQDTRAAGTGAAETGGLADAWGSQATADTDADTAATAGAAAAGAVAGTDDSSTSDGGAGYDATHEPAWGGPDTTPEHPDDDDSVAAATTETTAAMDSTDANDDAMEAQDWTGGVVAMEVDSGDPILASVGAVVARQSGVTMDEGDDGDTIAGAGTVWLGGGGNEVTVLTLQEPGLTVNRAALVAHSGGLTREDAHPGIVGFPGVRLSGAGWVALSAHGGLAEVPTTGGVDIAADALVAFTNDLDVSHADTVHLSGLGVALVSGG